MEKVVLDIFNEMKKMNNRMDDMGSDIKELKTDVAELKEDMIEVKADVAELKEDVTVLKSDMKQAKADIVVVKEDVNGLGLVVENKIRDDIQLLLEGQKSIIEIFDKNETALQSSDFYKYRVKLLEREVLELKRTQSM
jgi:chromosome segregation ATPase